MRAKVITPSPDSQTFVHVYKNKRSAILYGCEIGRGFKTMDESLLKEREAFKKRAKAIPVVEKKPSSTAKGSGEASVQQKHKKKKKSAYSRPKPVKLQTGNYIFMLIWFITRTLLY